MTNFETVFALLASGYLCSSTCNALLALQISSLVPEWRFNFNPYILSLLYTALMPI